MTYYRIYVIGRLQFSLSQAHFNSPYAIAVRNERNLASYTMVRFAKRAKKKH